MKSTLQRLATVKPSRYLEAGNPTGLTGLLTHPSPRSTLLYLYGATMDRLKAIPEQSVYRQSVEALTKNRMKIMESIKPAGYDEWAERAKQKIEDNPDVFMPGHSRHVLDFANGTAFVETQEAGENEDQEWDGEKGSPTLEGTRSSEEGAMNARAVQQSKQDQGDPVEWEAEPQLDASQISEAESQIGAGLIEEVIQVAEGELKLVNSMLEAKVWEELEEKPVPGQWEYAARDQHTPTTQEPPGK